MFTPSAIILLAQMIPATSNVYSGTALFMPIKPLELMLNTEAAL